MKCCILKDEADPAKFMEFWAKRYDERAEPIDRYYQEYITRSEWLLTSESVRKLFAWKALKINRKSIETGEHPFVRTVMDRLDHFLRLPLKTPEDANNFSYE